jgi:hexosaminidase
MLVAFLFLLQGDPAMLPMPAKVEFGKGKLSDASKLRVVTTDARDEAYTLVVTPEGAELEGGPLGVLRGRQTYRQLTTPDGVPEVKIEDRPRYAWRGLLIDVGRHFLSVETIKRQLDTMAMVKLNVLHWHLTEDQGFRVECKRYPKLHEMGSDGLYYTHEQIRDVVAYAKERGIRVVPEFDVPGHSTSWLVGYPELGVAPGPYKIERTWGIKEACLDPRKEKVYEFLDGFFGEMAALFPDEYVHIGGDEVKDKAIVARQPAFNKRLSDILKKHGKKMVGWDEIASPDLPKDIIVQAWRSRKTMKEYQSLLSYGFYLDHLRSAAYHYSIDPGDCLGGEACMWGEFVGEETVDSRIWPRAAAIAERLWSPARVTDVADLYRRLDALTSPKSKVSIGPNTEALIEVLEPVNDRWRTPFNQQTPMNRAVDAAMPDPARARQFMTDPRRWLTLWRDNHAKISFDTDILKEIEPVSEALRDLAIVGLEALDYHSKNVAPPPEWRDKIAAVFKRARSSRAHVKIAVLPGIRKLVDAALTE